MVSAEEEEGEKEIEEEDPTSLSLNNLDPSPPSFAEISPPPRIRRRLLIHVGRRSLNDVTNASRGRKVFNRQKLLCKRELGYSISPIPLRVEKAKLLDFARLLKIVLHVSSWLLVFAYSLLTLLKHPKCLHSLR
ncbi:hypothetical protein B296_00008449 [Ensete ventricosum]|uniref:Uncharacterized protein n=1 Tax=Ensete ventricosum TaxID=4639 RepID=A0A426Z880_ENSVE|nr:hypothetical protein B296_00008449 [Ensete ventricosum]